MEIREHVLPLKKLISHENREKFFQIEFLKKEIEKNEKDLDIIETVLNYEFDDFELFSQESKKLIESKNLKIYGPDSIKTENFVWNNGTKFLQTESNYWKPFIGSCLSEEKKYKWSFLIKKMESTGNYWKLIIGVTKEQNSSQDVLATESWGYCSIGISIYKDSPFRKLDKFEESDVITMICDLRSGELSFIKNNEHLGIIFTGITGPVYLYAAVNCKCQLEIMESFSE